MLKLKQIKKEYLTGESKVEALKGIDIEFINEKNKKGAKTCLHLSLTELRLR